MSNKNVVVSIFDKIYEHLALNAVNYKSFPYFIRFSGLPEPKALLILFNKGFHCKFLQSWF